MLLPSPRSSDHPSLRVIQLHMLSEKTQRSSRFLRHPKCQIQKQSLWHSRPRLWCERHVFCGASSLAMHIFQSDCRVSLAKHSALAVPQSALDEAETKIVVTACFYGRSGVKRKRKMQSILL
ncbi:hypothetical protein M378DRAFT_461135 [Amanita muscaria Koide BX008]|uniref:Uncharacterized protein n=1 Tax=Amanita muscaria (strain Koide BX008) TaxID=946122 RepID=A0A0C2TFX8_AMAMK|nr:hypothetical protein M378DRAFT_461135 [Amanita muscaria Koide BX008]